jgi:hypothetical protein
VGLGEALFQVNHDFLTFAPQLLDGIRAYGLFRRYAFEQGASRGKIVARLVRSRAGRGRFAFEEMAVILVRNSFKNVVELVAEARPLPVAPADGVAVSVDDAIRHFSGNRAALQEPVRFGLQDEEQAEKLDERGVVREPPRS